MIGLKRRRDKIPKAFQQPGLSKAALKLIDIYYAGAASGKFAFESSAWKGAKGALKIETGGKCAYCEAPTDTVAHGDVEHFRPKSVYWWLALCFDNYLYSCQICNQTYKGDNFPTGAARIAAPAMPAAKPADAELDTLAASLVMDASALTDATVNGLWLAEDADLPHPCLEDPSGLFAYEVDVANAEIVIRSGGGARADRATEGAIRFLGLNREELKRERYVNYLTLAAFKAILDAQPTAQVRQIAEQEILRMQRRTEPFAGMRRYFIGQWGLPAPADA